MARRRREAGSRRGERGDADSDAYYVTSDSDRSYAQQARQRTSRQAQRRWIVRLAVLAVLAFAVWMWGADVLRALRVQAHMTGQEFKEAGQHIRKGTDERSGANLTEGESP